FVYGVNTPSRWGTQAPFSNITLDWTVPADMAELPCLVGGEELDFCYKDCKKEMDMVNKAFIETMVEGDANGRGFQYPIPTYSITRDFDWSETENNKMLFEMTAKYGTPYFSNYVNSDMKPSDIRSMCCRLRLDLRELRKKSGGFFGSGESTGSVGVVTINMPRIAYLAKDREDFYKRLDNMMDIAARSLHVKREVITKLMDNGLYPYTKRYLGTFNNHFSTIGLVGMNEACLNANWLRKDLTDPVAQEFAIEVLNYMRKRLINYQEMYHDLYNLEATPAESTAYRLAKHDKQRYPDIITAAKEGETPYYTNSSHLPVGYTDDIFSALDIQDNFQTLYTSGTVFHAFLGEKLPDWRAAASLVKKISDNYKLPYYTLSPTYSICPEHGYINGEAYTCPKCGKKTEVWSRITGYYRPVQNWNDGKVQEFHQRKEYNIETSVMKARDIMNEVVEAKEAQKDEVIQETIQFDIPTIYVQDHCPKCKGAEQRLQVSGIEHRVVNCSQDMSEAERLNLTETPTIIDPDGTKFVGANAAAEWMKYHNTK
ncbi:MAG: ribonucleoside triphosphate reductase, partial [Erysipelotrichaceae bacterium]|nr:ribonucleoside triphosphate reductase [Erysipelotrichaceae bacterium]